MAPMLGALTGRRVAVTRAASQAMDLLALLRARGAEPLACPTIAVEPPTSLTALDAALRALDRYAWVAFTSANAVTAFADRLDALGVDLPATVRLAAIGSATAERLAARLRAPDFLPRTARADALGDEVKDVDGRMVLFPRGDLASDALVRRLRQRGATVDDVIVYRTIAGHGAVDLARLVRTGGVDAILFMSGSSVRHFAESLGPPDAAAAAGSHHVAVVCIGPKTARAAREVGLEVHAIANETSASGIVDAVERWFGRDGNAERR